MPLVIRTTGFEEYLDESGGAYIKALIMGEHGVGKTPSAANWPKPIIADCENGLMSVASMKVPYAPIKTPADMDALLQHLHIECKKPVESRKYQTLIIDTLDSFQRKVIQERLRSERKESFSGYGDWGYLDAKMQQLIERLLSLPMNIVVNLHTKDQRDGDEESSLLIKQARLKGDVKDSIYQDFDLIGQMETSYVSIKGERILKRQIRWHAEPRFPNLRDRSNRLPRFTDVDFTPNDYQRIFDAITSDLDEIPESGELETLEVEGDGVEVGEPQDGGPVASPEVPAAKRAAKKAAAKPAKKAAAKPAEVTPEPEKAPEDPSPAQAAQAAGDQAASTSNEDPSAGEASTEEERDAAAEQLLKDELGATPVEPEPEPEPEKPAAPANPNARFCGLQPASMAARFDAADGCGVELNGDNSASIAMVKAKTFLCNGCFAAWQQTQTQS